VYRARMARKLDPKSKAGFVRSQPASMPAADLVKAAKVKGIKLDVQYVYAVRGAKKKRSKATRALAKASGGTVTPSSVARTSEAGGLVAQIEAMASEMVAAALKEKLAKLLG
jgi:hypothetical protein